MSERRLRNIGMFVVLGGLLAGGAIRWEPLRTLILLAVFIFGVFEYWRAGNRRAAIGSVVFVIIGTTLALLYAYHNSNR
ncbi:MAG TPA: hypothetical protein VGF98_13100 [Candidatus Tumulicola sp.]|jgi:hypothetical protein